MDIADDAGYFPGLGLPGEKAIGVDIGPQNHIALVDTSKTLDGGAVEPDPLLNDLLQPAHGDGHILDRAHDVRELQTDEPHVVGLDPVQNLPLIRKHFAPLSNNRLQN